MLERVWREGTLYTLLGVRPGAATMEKSIVLEPSCSVVSDSLRPHGLNPPGSFVHGILQARILEWGAISFSRDLLDPRIEPRFPWSPAVAGRFFTVWAPGKPQCISTWMLSSPWPSLVHKMEIFIQALRQFFTLPNYVMLSVGSITSDSFLSCFYYPSCFIC